MDRDAMHPAWASCELSMPTTKQGRAPLMETTRSHRRRVAYYALITLLLTLVPGTIHARAMAPLGQATIRLTPQSAPLDPGTPYYRGAFDAGTIWELKQGEITAIQRGR